MTTGGGDGFAAFVERVGQDLLGRLGAALWPVELGAGPDRRVVTAVRWSHRLADGRVLPLVVLPRECTDGVTLGAFRLRPELIDPPTGSGADSTLLTPFLDHWTVRDDAALLVMAMADMDTHAARKGYRYVDAAVVAPDPADVPPREGDRALGFVLGHLDPDGDRDPIAMPVVLDRTTGIADAPATTDGFLGGLVMYAEQHDDGVAVGLEGLVVAAGPEGLRITPWEDVERDLALTLAPYL